METEKKGTENQAPLFLGKFKTEEEAKAHLDKLERDAQEAKEKLEQERRLNNLLADEGSTAPSSQKPPQTQPLGLESFLGEEGSKAVGSVLDNYRSTVLSEATKIIRTEIAASEARKEAEERFYTKYGDLKRYKDVANTVSNQLAAEHGSQGLRAMGEEKVFEQIAKRTREHIKSITNRATESHLHLEGGEVNEPNLNKQPKEEPLLTEDERTAAYFKDEVAAHNKRRGAALS